MDKSIGKMDSQDIDAEIASMRQSLGAGSETQLAEMLGISQASISQWRRRGSIPEKARRRVESYRHGGAQRLKMDARRAELGHQVLYEGRCLALFLAPALDATISRRFSLTNYMGALRNYTSLFDEIALACADAIHARQQQIGGNATDAFDSLAADDPKQLYETMLENAKIWRFGIPDDNDDRSYAIL